MIEDLLAALALVEAEDPAPDPRLVIVGPGWVAAAKERGIIPSDVPVPDGWVSLFTLMRQRESA